MPEPACPVCDADGVMPCDTPNGDPHPERVAVDPRLTDPTPTPDTLRAAIEALCDEWNRWQGEMAPHSITASTLRGCVTDVRAALAASPTPTDTPDERPCPTHPDAGPVRWFSVTAPPRFEGDTQQTGELPLCARCADEAYPSEQVEVDNPLRREVRPRRGTDPRPAAVGVCTYDAAPHAMFDDCADWRPAAVTAPREDERAALHDRLKRVLGTVPIGTRDLVNVLVGPDVAPWTARVLAAAAPAVERATPDPDTLAALLAKADGYPPPATAPAHYDQARALIAAGVTLNETVT